MAVAITNDPPTHRTDLPKKNDDDKIPHSFAESSSVGSPDTSELFCGTSLRGSGGGYLALPHGNQQRNQKKLNKSSKNNYLAGSTLSNWNLFRDPKKKHGKNIGFRLSWHPPRYEIKERHGRHLADRIELLSRNGHRNGATS